jgi:AcrR family transcriptional regulator
VSEPQPSLDVVAHTALKLIEREGLDALSLRSVADELGVQALTLYRVVPNRASVLDAVGELMIQDSGLADPHRSDDWREQLSDLAYAFRDVARRYPQAFPLIVTRTMPTPVSLMPIERILHTLENAGLRGPDTVRVERAIISIVMGSLLWEIATTAALGGQPRVTVSPAVMTQLGSLTPHVFKHAAELVHRDHDVEFEYCVKTIIGIVEHALERLG